MNRRSFLGTSAALGLAGPAAAQGGKNQYLELRFYEVTNDRDKQRERLNAFFKDQHLPMMKRLGIGPVGYFQVAIGADMPRIITIAAYDSLADYQQKFEQQRTDKRWSSALTAATASDGAMFDRIETWLMRAFDGMPTLEAPPLEEGKAPRVFDLRIYESATLEAAARKVAMFNSGEIPLFRETGLNPLFFGETLAGGKMPNLAYAVWYDDWAARDKAWDTFRVHPEWKKMSSDPRWANTVSNITDIVLQPLPFSPIR